MSDRTFEQQLREHMPVHDCGRRMEPGGSEALGPLLVCVACGYIEEPDPEWVDDVVARIREGDRE